MNKSRQNQTKPEQATGLTPTQEQAAILLASGETITNVAKQLEVGRATIYEWQKYLPFQCFFNRLCADNRATIINGLQSLSATALSTIKDCLSSNNEQVKLKAAFWICEKIVDLKIEQTDIFEELAKQSTIDLNEWDTTKFDESKYKRLLKEYGLRQ